MAANQEKGAHYHHALGKKKAERLEPTQMEEVKPFLPVGKKGGQSGGGAAQQDRREKG